MKTLTMMLLAGSITLASAQTQVTGDTLGKGKAAMFASSNALAVKDFTVLTASTLQYWRGVTNRVDAFAGITLTTALGQQQASVTGGANINLVKTKLASVAVFNTLTTPLHRRNDSSAAVWFAAGVVSHDFHVATLYGGYSATVPLGHPEDKLFTPPGVVHNLPMGSQFPKVSSLFLWNTIWDMWSRLAASALPTVSDPFIGSIWGRHRSSPPLFST